MDLLSEAERSTRPPNLKATARMQQIVEMATLGVYGPARVRFDVSENRFVWSGNWLKGRREPILERRSFLRKNAIAATCSPLVNLVMGVWVAANADWSSKGGRSMWWALRNDWEDGGYSDYVTPMFPRRRNKSRPRLVSLKRMLEAEEQMPLVSVVRLANPRRKWCHHVVIALRCGQEHLTLVDPATDLHCGGLWLLDASGYFRDVRRKKMKRKVREFSGSPIRVYPADHRDLRTKMEIWNVTDPDEEGIVPGPYEANSLPLLFAQTFPQGEEMGVELNCRRRLMLAAGMKVNEG